MSLDEFQSRYASEDDASFSAILKDQHERQRSRYSWVFNRETNSLALEAPTPSAASADPPKIAPATWDYKARSALMYYPDGVGSDLPSAANGKKINYSGTRLVDKPGSVSEFLPSPSQVRLSSLTACTGSSLISEFYRVPLIH